MSGAEGDLDPATLDPGIRRLVMVLRQHGFDTCDSGDGSKAQTMECAIDVPMVAISVSRASDLVRKVRVLASVLRTLVKAETWERDGVAVETSYSPITGEGFLVVLGISDADLVEAETSK